MQQRTDISIGHSGQSEEKGKQPASGPVGLMAGSHPRTASVQCLFLAQLPPPIHGLAVVSARVHEILKDNGWQTDRRSQVSARSLQDIGQLSASKLFELAALVFGLFGSFAIGRRYAAAYLTFTPWSHAALRDAGVAWIAGLLARRVLVHIHTEGLAKVIQGTGLREHLLRRLLRHAELIVITEQAAELARQSGFFSEVHQLGNCVDDPWPAGRGGPDAGMASQAGRPLRCVYLGNFDERKGVFDFVAVISQAKAAGIAIEAKIMGGATRFVSEGDLQQAIETHGVVDAIELVGFVDEAEKSRILQAADLFIYPTRHDHAPLVLIEAMAHGTVPLTLDAGGIRSMLGSELAHNVFSHRADAEARQTWMVERIQAYATEPAALVRDADVSRALYERNHTPAAFERDLRAILDRPQVLPRTHPQP